MYKDLQIKSLQRRLKESKNRSKKYTSILMALSLIMALSAFVVSWVYLAQQFVVLVLVWMSSIIYTSYTIFKQGQLHQKIKEKLALLK